MWLLIPKKKGDSYGGIAIMNKFAAGLRDYRWKENAYLLNRAEPARGGEQFYNWDSRSTNLLVGKKNIYITAKICMSLRWQEGKLTMHCEFYGIEHGSFWEDMQLM